VNDPILVSQAVTRRFGGILAVDAVDFAIERGSITSLIGPNGAGKTTLFNAITGIFPPSSGRVEYYPAAHQPAIRLDGLRVDQITARGLARTFQNIRLFSELTALENVKLGSHAPTERGSYLAGLLERIAWLFRNASWLTLLYPALALCVALTVSFTGGSVPHAVAVGLLLMSAPLALAALAIAPLALAEATVTSLRQLFGPSQQERQITHAALAYLDFVGLLPRADEVAANLAYGDQRRLEIARALACQPRLLMLDEPAAGMNPSETVQLMALINKIRDAGITILLIEHDMKLVMNISDHVVVLDRGALIASGAPATVASDPRVIEAYLGTSEA
jgi:branched-chain amino acid transport system ATP-binding protein